MKHFTRRDFLRVSALSACSLVVSTGLTGCDETSNSKNISFDYGVASGDPLQDKVIIWTRVTPLDSQEEVKVEYEVAKDKEFKSIVNNGVATTTKENDFTLKVDVQELDDASRYFYRFKSEGITSEIGEMTTLAQGSLDKVSFAVFSCANYTNGYFNVYKEATNLENLDVAIHLGDYIYEYGMYEADGVTPAYATKNAVKLGREFAEDNATECLKLEDYRKRYALYRSDESLQELHKKVPMIVVWDDHEIANDSYKDGAQNHNEGEGEYDTRVDEALQAYFEWLPIRPIENKKDIYRSFAFGDLVELYMLETRISARDKQLSYANYYNAVGEFDTEAFTRDLTNPSRGMMGETQLQWLQSSMANSKAKWQVLGQQVIMGRMNLPSELLTPIAQLDNPEAYGTTTEALMSQINTSLLELSQIKTRLLSGDSTLSELEKARVQSVSPYNLDAWDGYFIQRETIFATAKALGKDLVVLAGDSHNAWANNLHDISGEKVGVEFATSSVSSPGLEEYLGLKSLNEARQLEGALSLLIDDLTYTNLMDRGFVQVEFTKESAKATWHFVDTIDSSEYTLNTSRAKSLHVKAGEHTLLS